MDEINITVGDLVTDRVLWKDDAYSRVEFIKRGDKIHVETTYKTVGALLQANNELAADWSRNQKLGEIVQVASIPNHLYWQWYSDGIIDDEEYLSRRLNDAEFAKLRTNGLVI